MSVAFTAYYTIRVFFRSLLTKQPVLLFKFLPLHIIFSTSQNLVGSGRCYLVNCAMNNIFLIHSLILEVLTIEINVIDNAFRNLQEINM